MSVVKNIVNMKFLGTWLLSSVLLTVFMNCSSIDKNDTVYVDTDSVAETFRVNDFFSDIDTIQLSIDKEVRLGKVVKVIAPDNYFVLLHNYGSTNQNYVAVFDASGRLLYSLEPSDDNFYSFNPLDVSIVGDEGDFEILEGKTNEVWRYDKIGNVVARKKLPFSADNFTFVVAEDVYVFYKNERILPNENEISHYDVIFTDTAFMIVNKYFPLKLKKGPFTKVNLPFPLGQSPQGDVFFAKSLTDSLLVFEKTQRIAKRDVSFDFPFSIKNLDKRSIDLTEADMQNVLNAQGGLLAGYYAYGKNILSFNLVNVDGPIWGILELNSGRSTVGHQGISKGKGVFPPFVSYLPGQGFAAVLNESSLAYTPDHYLNEGLAEQVVNTNNAFLLIAAEN